MKLIIKIYDIVPTMQAPRLLLAWLAVAAMTLPRGDTVKDDPRGATHLRPTCDRRTACAILMTKNEWPTLRSWVLHHGDLLGFENVHIIPTRLRSTPGIRMLLHFG
jgi:hypothetical protein